MMIVMPLAVEWLGLSDIVGGAWIGGTIDTTGAVVVAGESIGDSATNAATIVKLSQNALLGVAAFALSVWWTVRGGASRADEPSVSAKVIWERFPKFVLGFLATSLLFSFVLSDGMVDATAGVLKGLRTWLFAVAFVCIGLETRLRDLLSMQGGRPAAAFVLAQAANVLWTLLLAWLLFGGPVFAVPDL